MKKRKKDAIYNLKINKKDLELAREYCDENFISLANEVRKLIYKYTNAQITKK